MQEVDPSDAPVVVWLQGGPGSSSMFGLFEIHGPISVVYDENDNIVGEEREYTWSRRANMLYIDQPVGTGELPKAFGSFRQSKAICIIN